MKIVVLQDNTMFPNIITGKHTVFSSKKNNCKTFWRGLNSRFFCWVRGVHAWRVACIISIFALCVSCLYGEEHSSSEFRTANYFPRLFFSCLVSPRLFFLVIFFLCCWLIVFSPLLLYLQPPPKTQIKGMMQTPRLFLILRPSPSESTCQQPRDVEKASFFNSQCKKQARPNILLIAMCKTKCGINLSMHSNLNYYVSLCHWRSSSSKSPIPF